MCGPFLRAFVLCGCVVLVPFAAIRVVHGAENPAPTGSSWKGVVKIIGAPDKDKNRIRSSDALLKIKKRDKEDFTGVLEAQTGTRAWEIQGTISDRGAVKFTVTAKLKSPDDSVGDAVGRATFIGAIKEKKLKGKFTIPKNTGPGYRAGRFGEMELTLEE